MNRRIINPNAPTAEDRLAAFRYEAACRSYDIDPECECPPEVDGAVVRFDGEAVWLVTEQEAAGHADKSECETFYYGTDPEGKPVLWFLVLC